MKYKGYTIYANAKRYSLWSIDDNGTLDELEHEYEGQDLISYVVSPNDELPEGDRDFETLDQAKRWIDDKTKLNNYEIAQERNLKPNYDSGTYDDESGNEFRDEDGEALVIETDWMIKHRETLMDTLTPNGKGSDELEELIELERLLTKREQL